MHEDGAVPGLSVGRDLEVVLEAVIDDGSHGRTGRRTVLELRWHRDDALAVHLHLTAQPDHPALPRGEWVLLRDLVRTGLAEPTGDGSVRVRPDEVRDRIWIELDLPTYGRSACVSVPRDRVRAFVALTEQQVPHGGEGSAQAVEDLLQRILD